MEKTPYNQLIGAKAHVILILILPVGVMGGEAPLIHGEQSNSMNLRRKIHSPPILLHLHNVFLGVSGFIFATVGLIT